MPLTITMLTFHHADYVARMAEALAKQVGSLPFYDVYLVNNGGCDETDKVATAAGWKVIRPGYNTSYAEGHNLAANVSHRDDDGDRYRYLLQLNDDLIPEETFLHEFWASRGAADIIGGLQLYPNGTVNHAGGHLAPLPNHIGRHAFRHRFEGHGVKPTEWVTGAALMIRRGLYNDLGGLDEMYWYGSEDCDLCLKAIEAGCRIGVNHSAVSIHGELGTRLGGAADLANEMLFRERWYHKLPELAAQARAAWPHA